MAERDSEEKLRDTELEGQKIDKFRDDTEGHKLRGDKEEEADVEGHKLRDESDDVEGHKWR
ncbi:MAG: hypothetical protein GEU28_15065 [Dehalococcoidia bacterium]|nr:hypothetical protein [Dehalococcoidia bacterium]